MYEEIKDGSKLGLWIAVFLFVLAGLGIIGKILLTPAALVEKTLDANNIIHNYEWFHDVHAQVLSRRGQIAGHFVVISAEADAGELRRLRMEMAAMQQTCRDLVNQYNANSAKVNRTIFKGKSLPVVLESSTCEAQ